MPLGRILPWPSGTVPAQPACVARVAHGLAQLDRRECARGGMACACCGAARLRCGGDLTGAREAAGESTARPHRCVDGGAAELVGVDGGVGRHGGSAATYEDDGGEG
jgi:hypothetical protein